MNSVRTRQSGEWLHDVGTEKRVTCPACGGDNCHPTRVEVNQGGRVDTIDKGGHRAGIAPPSGRGSSVAVHFYCEECPALFAAAFQFHKGGTYSSPVVVGAGVVGESPPGGELWRD